MHKYSNKLVNETSPYLLQHAHNPVNWYPWGEEALQKAVKEDKPILASIGYSACHWCHVMEKESFEDEQTATLMNDLFICIKIDREERPDLDHIYMDAVQAITGSGGWPLNVFLTPKQKPFYGGTYFPPVRAFNRASWKEVLLGVSQLYKEKRNEVEAQAEELVSHIGQSFVSDMKIEVDAEELFTKKQFDEIFNNIMKQADATWGGFGNAPKFPQTFSIKYLLRYHYYTGNKEALEHATLSLDKMIQGGIYDQAGGGFARYSTDREWLAPHFEKMLYDNALLIDALSEAYQLTKKDSYKKIVEQTVKFIERELMSDDGGFYSALDADSEGEEGKFYVWSYDEIKNILKDDAELFCEFYDVSIKGNWSEEQLVKEPRNILRILKPLAEFAKQKNIDVHELEILLRSCSEKIIEHRNKRIRPGLDDKILLGWNALMITALCKSSSAFSDPYFKDLAVRNFDFLFSKLRASNDSHEFYHTYKNGAKFPAFLDDYSSLIGSCIALQEVTSEQKYIEHAKLITAYVLDNFSSDNYFFYTGKNQDDVVIRKKEVYDNATPSGNSVMAGNLLYLSTILNNGWKEKGLALLGNLSEVIIKYPTSFGNWACLMIDNSAAQNEIAICGNGFEHLRDHLLEYFIPNKVLQCAISKNDNYPLLAHKDSPDKALIYLCRNYSCLKPEDNIAPIVNQIVKNVKIR